MFLEISKDELDTGFLKIGRRFWSGKRRKVAGGRRAYSVPREGEYGCESHLDEGSCDEEEEYSTISEREESKESAGSLRTRREYDIPRRSPKVRPRSSSLEPYVKTSSLSVGTGVQGSPSVTPINPTNPGNPVNNPSTTLMVGTNVRIPTFNGNGTEDPE